MNRSLLASALFLALLQTPKGTSAATNNVVRSAAELNAALREIVAPVIGFSKRVRTARRPRNSLSRFRGTLTKEDLAPIIAAQADFSRIDEDMWK